MSFKNKKTLLGLTTIVMVMLFCAEAYAVKIIPPRLVLGPDITIEYMFIKNNSDKQEAYRFKWKHVAMDKEGNILNLDKIGLENAPSGYQPVDKLIRFSPRRAVLKPGQTQRVTFMIRRPQNAPAGEYRSHFMVEREPRVSNAPQAQQQELPPQEPAPQSSQSTTDEPATPVVSFDVLVSRAVPIYVLNGETNASLELLGAEIKKNKEKVKPHQPDYLVHFRVKKTGNRSVIGIARVFCQSGDKEIPISKPGKVFAVYAEGEYRNEKMAVELPAKSCSSYRMIIKGHPDDVLAGQTLVNNTFK